MITIKQKEALINEAKKALENPYAMKNNSQYSAAVLTSQGNIYPELVIFLTPIR